MTNYREILRLKKLGLNNSQIAQSLGCSRTTVIQVLNVAEEKRSRNTKCRTMSTFTKNFRKTVSR